MSCPGQLDEFTGTLCFGEIAGRSAEVGIPSQPRPMVLPSVAAVVAEGARKLIELAGDRIRGNSRLRQRWRLLIVSANVPPTQNGAPSRPWDATRVSMVQNGTDTNTEHVTVAVILAGIRNGRWQKPVAHVKTRYLSAFQAAKQQGDRNPYETAKEAVREIKKK